MTDLMDVMAEAKSAVQPLAEDVKITGTETCDDCSGKVEIHVDNLIDAPTCNESETDESGSSDDTPDEQTEQTEQTGDTENTQACSDTSDNPEKAWAYRSWNTIQSVARVVEEEFGVSRPENRDKDTLTEYLEGIKGLTPTDDLPESPSDDEIRSLLTETETASEASDTPKNDEETTTPDAGVWSKAKVDGRDIYTVNGEEYTVNGLRSEVSDMDVEYDTHWTGEDMAELVAEGGSAGNSEDSGTDDDTPDIETVKGRGVPADYAETVVDLFEKGHDECTTEGCAMAANKDSSICYWCDKGEVSPAMSGATDESEDIPTTYKDLSEGKKELVQEELDMDEDLSLEEAVRKVA